MTKIRKINYIASIVVMILAIFAISANVLAEEAPEETAEAAPLEVTCSADVEHISSGESITWTVEISGGTAPFFYNWSGTDGLSGNGTSVTKTYTESGAKYATVEVGHTEGMESADCDPVGFVEPLEFVSCIPSENTSNTGYEVSWDVNFTGGIAPYLFVITGDDGLSGDENEAKITYTTVGTKNAEVTGVYSSDGKTLTGPFACSPVEVVEAPVEALSVSCSANASSADEGEEVTWSAEISGGLAPFTYDWSGTDGLSGSSEEVSKTYSSDGDKSASVTVTSSNGDVKDGVSCGSVSVEEVSSGGSSSGGSTTGGSRRNNNNNNDDDAATTTESGSGSNTTTTTTVGGGTNTGGFVVTSGTVAGATTTATSSDDTATTTATTTGAEDAGDDENLNQLAGLFAFFGDISAWIWFILLLIVLGLILWFILSRNKREDEGEGSSN